MSALEERRQAAREAFYDAAPSNMAADDCLSALGEAIETATRVQITSELVGIYTAAWAASGCNRAAGLKAALESCGFEVEQT
jgi:hypothetical protein